MVFILLCAIGREACRDCYVFWFSVGFLYLDSVFVFG